AGSISAVPARAPRRCRPATRWCGWCARPRRNRTRRSAPAVRSGRRRNPPWRRRRARRRAVCGSGASVIPLYCPPMVPPAGGRCRPAATLPGLCPAVCAPTAHSPFRSHPAAPAAPEPRMTSTAELSSPSSANTPLTSSVVDPDYSLDHKYSRESGRIYLSGVQALVRLPLMQRLRDQAAGLETAGFISGYRGSPLGGFDLELWRAKKHLEAAGVKFAPGLNEDL